MRLDFKEEGHLFTDLCRVSLALECAAQVVDDNAGASRAEESGIGLAQTTASSGDDHDLAVVSQLLSHDVGKLLCVCDGG